MRVAVVTGGSRGIGRRIAEVLAAEGFAVALGYGKDKVAAETVVDGIAEAGGRVSSVGGDELVDGVPLGRLGQADDIARIVLDLANSSRWVNGQTIHANGGLV